MYLKKLQDTMATISDNIEFTRLYQNLGVVAPEWQGVHDLFLLACARVDMKKIRVQSDPGGLEIYADPLLERVFYNLVENAVQYGKHLTLIRLSARESGSDLIIRVEDDGIGVPSHDKEKIVTRGYGRNTGLGLFLCREILSITGITVTETGEYQRGACFEMRVPKGAYRLQQAAANDRCYISFEHADS
jgi:signal transduction histidine kinase